MRSDIAIDPRITFTRASNASYFDNAGTLQTAGSGVARSNAYQDHNPSTLAPLGFLIEEQRTNSLTNNTMQGAVAGSPGTLPTSWVQTGSGALTRTIVGVGVEDGITYIDINYAGTPTTTSIQSLTFGANITIVAGEVWTNSCYFKLQAGTLTNVTSFVLRLGGESGTSFTPDGTLTRIQNVRTATGTVASGVVRWNYADTVTPVDFTLRIGLPQLELGAFATSPILTSGAAATRLADVASMTGTNFSSWFNATDYTLVLAGSMSALVVNAVMLEGGASSIQGASLTLDPVGTKLRAIGRQGATRGDTGVLGPSVTVGQAFKLAIAQNAGYVGFAANGSSIASSATPGQSDWGTQLNFARRYNGTLSANMHIQGLTSYRKALPVGTLETLTS